jgi:hypothetical protein
MEKIKVRTQQELNEIPVEYTGQIIIDGGGEGDPIIISKKYHLHPLVINQSYIVALWHTQITVRDTARVWAYQYAKITAAGRSVIIAHHNAKVRCWGNCRVLATDLTQVEAFGNARVLLWKRARCRAVGKVCIRGFDHTQAYLNQDSYYIRNSDCANAYFKGRAKEVEYGTPEDHKIIIKLSVF